MKYLLLILLLINNAFANIPEHNITYKLFAKGIEIGSEHRVLTQKNGIYTYHSQAQTEGLLSFFTKYEIKAESRFIIDNGIRSQFFQSVERKNNKIKKQINLTFTDIVKDNLTDNSWQNNGCVDFLNMSLAIGYDFKRNNPLEYCLADGKEVKQYSFKNQGITTLHIMDKDIDAIKLDADNISVYVAPEYDYLTVLIEKESAKYELKSIQ